MNKYLYKTGFTLIEILVVISIIGILSSVLYASFGEARDDSRNKALQAELREVQLALELYKSQNDRYPVAETTCDSYNALGGGIYTTDNTACGATAIVAGVVPDFIADLPLPADSGNTDCNFSYKTDGGGTWYKLTAEHCAASVTESTGVQSGDELARCVVSAACPNCDTDYISSAPFYESYAIYSAGGECAGL